MDEMGFVKIFFNILDALVDEGGLLYLVDKSGIIIENPGHPSNFFRKRLNPWLMKTFQN